jgi:glycosyltransferase involved in cell wall biosynthesis
MVKDISFLIPAFNVERFLQEAVTSIINQADFLDNFEIIICDNCSTDNTFQIAKKLEEDNPDVLRVFQNAENRGPAFSLNRCWEKAIYDHTFLLHSDNAFYKSAIKNVMNYVNSPNYESGIVFGDIEYMDEDGEYMGQWFGDHLGVNKLDNEKLIHFYIDENGSKFRPIQFFIDRTTFEKVGKYSEDYWVEDWEFTIRYLMAADFHRIPHVLVKFRENLNSLGHDPVKCGESMLEVIHLHANKLKPFIDLKLAYTNTAKRELLMYIHRGWLFSGIRVLNTRFDQYELISKFSLFVFMAIEFSKFKIKQLLFTKS